MLIDSLASNVFIHKIPEGNLRQTANDTHT